MNEAKKLDESIRSTDCDVEEVNEALRLWQTQLSNLDYLLSYAVLLAKSRITTDRRTAASHLKYLVTQEHNLQATLFQYSIVLYSLEQYDSARQTIASLLRLEPESKQIKDLHAAMSYKVVDLILLHTLLHTLYPTPSTH